jgi:antitoxin VapB
VPICYISFIYGIRGVSYGNSKAFLVGTFAGGAPPLRLPKEFRLPGNEVRIRRHGSAVIIEPLGDDWEWLDAIVGQLDDDFVEAANEQPGEQRRPALDRLFP